MNNKGFTLLELILVIVIVGTLAVSVAPKFLDFRDQAKTVVTDSVVAGIQSGLSLYAAEKIVKTGIETYPPTLDSIPDMTSCSLAYPCFTEVLKEPVTDDTWHKINGNNYDWSIGSTARHYHYLAGTGVMYEGL